MTSTVCDKWDFCVCSESIGHHFQSQMSQYANEGKGLWLKIKLPYPTAVSLICLTDELKCVEW